MLFNSIDFAIFLPAVFLLYWAFEGKRRAQNLILVLASYLFYGWWDWRFLSLLILSSLIDFQVGRKLGSTAELSKRKQLLCVSLATNLGMLGFFKYFNFFLENFRAAFSFLGQQVGGESLAIVLPVGISFYTFQTLSYSIDVYRGELEPTNDPLAFAAFVSFFPQLVAGPIERATALLPQFHSVARFDYREGVLGLRQILWGFVKKVVVADNCARHVNAIFDSGTYTGSTLVLGVVLFAFQIYGDFSGYSDIAIGTARLFGVNLMTNFAYPYFSRDIGEFWRRWHISLSTWFRDYLYVPLGGSRVGPLLRVRNIFAIFIVSGFWHGASWTFVIWGALNALYFLPLQFMGRNRKNMTIVAADHRLPSIRELLAMGVTFSQVCLAWVFFRAENLSHALDYLKRMTENTLSTPEVLPLLPFAAIGTMTVLEWIGRREEFPFQSLPDRFPTGIRWCGYFAVVLVIFLAGGEEHEFIYFQF